MNKQTAEEIKAKYEKYISNMEWHIKTNKPTGPELEKIDMRLDCYREIVKDLSSLK